MPNDNVINAQQAGMVSGLGRNHAGAFNNEGYNTFDRSSRQQTCMRFADVNPIHASKHIAGDNCRLRSTHDLYTYTLKSRNLSNVKLHKGYFFVPQQILLPNTYGIFMQAPNHGNDISDDVKPKFPLGLIARNQHQNGLVALVLDHAQGTSGPANWLNAICLLYHLLSRDGILARLGYSFDTPEGIEDIPNLLMNDDADIRLDGFSLLGTNGETFEERREVLQDIILCRKLVPYTTAVSVLAKTGVQSLSSWWSKIDAAVANIPNWVLNSSLPYHFINLEPVLSYQLICAQFFTNPYVDDVCSSDEWMMNQETIRQQLSSGFTGFIHNGVAYRYDSISRYVFINEVDAHLLTYDSASMVNKALGYLFNLFEVHRSLKLNDYFNDARLSPLAVGNVTAPVVGTGVSAVDVNRSLWMQRLLNATNRIPQNIVSYMRQMFGVNPQTRPHQPMRIAEESFAIGAQEIENTSDVNQGNVVQNLRSANSNWQFETRLQDAGYILGVVSFSTPYGYMSSYTKMWLEFDRYENFNPFLQHVGDQPILAGELINNMYNHATTFGYQQNYSQYKYGRFTITGGLTAPSMASWVSCFDRTKAAGFWSANSPQMGHDFIRNSNQDFDNYYSSLTALAGRDYYHFICDFTTLLWCNSKQQKFNSLM